MILLLIFIISIMVIGYWLHNFYFLKVIYNEKNLFENISSWPPITFIIPASNEEKIIENKIKNIYTTYNPEQITIIVAVNNSTDNTKNICEKLNIKVVPCPSGKLNALEQARKIAKDQFILVTDADVLLEKKTVKILVSDILKSEESVCAISAYCRLILKKNMHFQRSVEKYEHMQTKICQAQGFSSSSALIQGPCYLFKKSLMPPFETDASEDELSTALNIISSGYKVKTNIKAICYQQYPDKYSESLIMLVRQAGRQIITCIKQGYIIHKIKSRQFKFFIFPFYIIFPRFLPLCTFSLLVLSFDMGISIVIFYGIALLAFCILFVFFPFSAIQIIAVHLGWICAFIYFNKGSAWTNHFRK